MRPCWVDAESLPLSSLCPVLGRDLSGDRLSALKELLIEKSGFSLEKGLRPSWLGRGKEPPGGSCHLKIPVSSSPFLF